MAILAQDPKARRGLRKTLVTDPGRSFLPARSPPPRTSMPRRSPARRSRKIGYIHHPDIGFDYHSCGVLQRDSISQSPDNRPPASIAPEDDTQGNKAAGDQGPDVRLRHR